MALPTPNQAPPLQVRAGALFTCHGDGLCCTDVHALGPVSPQELITLRRLHKNATYPEAAVNGLGIRTEPSGACVFLQAPQGCRVHTEIGGEHKPLTCQRYPFNLVGTPKGLRVATPHRCPCRSLGQRAPVTEKSVADEIWRPGRRLHADFEAPKRIRIKAGLRVPFDEWRERETGWIGDILASEDPLSVLRAPSMKPLRTKTWDEVAATLMVPSDGSGFDHAKGWLGAAIMGLTTNGLFSPRPRPWSQRFAFIAQRVPDAVAPHTLIADWLADEVWSLHWSQMGNFAKARMDMANRGRLVQHLASHFAKEGSRPDLATAEAIMIVDVVSRSQYWYPIAQDVFDAPD